MARNAVPEGGLLDVRGSAWVCVFAGLAFLVHGLVVPWIYERSDPNSVEASATSHLVTTSLLLVACLAFIVALPVLLALLRTKVPRLATVAWVLVIPGLALYVGVVFLVLFGFPFLAEKAPEVLDAEVAELTTGGGTPSLLAGFILGNLPLKIGLLVLGIGGIVAGRPWRGPGIVLVAALPVTAIHNQVLPWDLLGAWAVFGLGLAWFGVAARSARTTTAAAHDAEPLAASPM